MISEAKIITLSRLAAPAGTTADDVGGEAGGLEQLQE
jgi:hypothetical protein